MINVVFIVILNLLLDNGIDSRWSLLIRKAKQPAVVCFVIWFWLFLTCLTCLLCLAVWISYVGLRLFFNLLRGLLDGLLWQVTLRTSAPLAMPYAAELSNRDHFITAAMSLM